jgi:PAS domain S-box-containing protein
MNLRNLAAIPVAVLVMSIFVTLFFDFSDLFVLNPPYLLLSLNLIFWTMATLAITYISARSYLKDGSLTVLFLSSSIIVFGLSVIASAWVGEFSGPLSVAVSNPCLLAAAVIQVFSSFLSLKQTQEKKASNRKVTLVAVYLASTVLVVVNLAAVLLGYMPTFFNASGPTLLRQAVLGSAVFFLGVASIVFGVQYHKSKAPSLFWYAFAIALLCIGLFSAFEVKVLGDVPTWLGRITLYAGTSYLVAAILASRQKGAGIDLAGSWAQSFKSNPSQLNVFFSNMFNGFAYCKIVTDKGGKSIDYIFVDVNSAFETITGLKKEEILGKKASEIMEADALTDWLAVFAPVALTGKPVTLDHFSKFSKKWIHLSVYSPQKDYFISISEDITERKKAEEDLHQSEERFRQVFERSALGIAVGDLEGRVVESNLALEDMLGYTKEELRGKRFSEFTHPDDATIELSYVQELIVGKRDHYEIEKRYIRQNGDVIWVHLTGGLIRGRNKEPLIGIATVEDITERKKAIEVMAFNSSLAENLSEAVISTDLDYRIRTWNKAAEAIYGYKAYEVIGKNTTDVLKTVIPDSGVRQAALRLLETGFSRGEAIQCRKDGEPVNVLFSVSLLKDKNGNPLAIVAVNRDITRRKRNEESLAKQAALIDLSLDGIMVMKLDGTITLWNHGAENLYGWTKNEAVGQQSNKLLKTRFVSEPFDTINEKIRLSGKWSGELIHTTKSGQEIVVQSWWRGRFNEKNEIAEILESNVDVTERKRMQIKLEEYSQNLEKLVEERTRQLKDAERLAAIGATAGMVGHDIRNPLQAITSDVYLAKSDLTAMPEGEEKENLQESLIGIEKNVEYINKIVQDLQDYARPLSPSPKEIDLETVFDDVLVKKAIPKGIKVTRKVEIGAEKVVGDFDLLKRILANLTSNAVQAMPNGGKLSVRAVREEKDLVITVKDTGVGIPEDAKSRIFTPLFTTKSKGQGFGLVVVKRMTEALGGTIAFESEVGKGTKFIVRLPPQRNER